MKTKLLIATLLITNFIKAQTTIGFETLTVPNTGYFNGSTEYSGSGNEETITYEEDIANLHINYTDTGAYDYWSAFAYTNQTDLSTASYTNYSAYSPNGGGANNSNNYVIAYLYAADEITLDHEVIVQSINVANSVWAYKYMDGSDGSMHDYTAGDYLKLSITGILNDNTYTTPIDFYLADFTNGNTTIIADWTTVNLSSFGGVKGLKFQLSSNDNFTPFYFCLDDIVYGATASINDSKFENTVSLYPNPTTDFITVSNVNNATITINDIHGKVILEKNNYSKNERISLQNIDRGIYFVKIKSNNKIAIKKMIIE